MKKFAKENWFKIIISLAFVSIAVSVCYYFFILIPQKEDAVSEEQANQRFIQANQYTEQAKAEQNKQSAKQQAVATAEDPQIKIEKCKVTALGEAQQQTAIHGSKLPTTEDAIRGVNAQIKGYNDTINTNLNAYANAVKSEDDLILKQYQVMMNNYYNKFYYQCLNS